MNTNTSFPNKEKQSMDSNYNDGTVYTKAPFGNSKSVGAAPNTFLTGLPPHLIQSRERNKPNSGNLTVPIDSTNRRGGNMGGNSPVKSPALDDDYEGPPRRCIFVADDMPNFLKSQAYVIYSRFLIEMNEAMKETPLSSICVDDNVKSKKSIEKILSVFDEMKSWIGDIPLIKEKNFNRFGNMAFRTWFSKMVERSDTLMQELFYIDKQGSGASASNQADQDLKLIKKKSDKWKITELSSYFRESFGNKTRIDYGTGHEAAFCAWMYCIYRLQIVEKEDIKFLVGKIFPAYLSLMRKLQLHYKLEPAGSHGVWGLDDYQFLPFLWGSSQLIHNKEIKTSSIHKQEVLDEYSHDYIYLSGIKFIREVKKGPFGEHSPMLNDISGVPRWSKVNSGMIKMYHAEVLKKFVVIQHFLFGKLLPFKSIPGQKAPQTPQTPESPASPQNQTDSNQQQSLLKKTLSKNTTE